MSIIRKLLIALAGLLLTAGLCAASNPQEKAASELAGRLLPTQSRNIRFKQVPSDVNCYQMEAKGGKLTIKADCVNSMAMALGDYLRDYCNLTPTWYSRDVLQEPSRLPDTGGKVERQALLKNRFFLNYCTYGYTIGWWNFEQWERLIDWMALNGVTMALNTAGQESVWQRVWMRFGLTAEQTREYFTGPSCLSWHRMTNMDSWHSPLPQKWLDAQCELQKQIIAREVSLGISPILGSFTGHVPEVLKDIYPDANIRKLSAWGDFSVEYNPWYLDPEDPLYVQIQKAFLEEQKLLYGQDSHIYGIDLFNEVDPPSWDSEYLGNVARRTYEILAESDPDAVWLQMAWLFYHGRKHWTQDRIEAYISPVPKHKLIMLDYYCDKTEIYPQTKNFYGQDFIWSYLGNFGGNTSFAGNLNDVSQKIDKVISLPGGNCVGLGCTLEALDVNSQMYEYVLDRAWERKGTDDDWVQNLADRHLGRADESNRAAWKLMKDDLMKTVSGHTASMLTARPTLGHPRWSKNQISYDNEQLHKAWEQLLAAGPSDSPAYKYDCVNFGRQYLTNRFTWYYNRLANAYRLNEKEKVAQYSAKMLEILDDLENLTATDGYFLLGRWVEEARYWGDTPEEKAYFEWDARDILTCWGFKGGKLVDYANREWNGLISTYYKPRWEKFFELLQSEEPFDEQAFKKWSEDFEWNWIGTPVSFPSKASGDAWKTSCELLQKYPPIETVRVLAIGNSFSVDAVNQYLGELAVANDKHIIVGNAFIPGCPLQRHCKNLRDSLPDYIYYKRMDDGNLEATKNSTIFDAIYDEPWDIVTFQQASPVSGLPDTYEPYIGELVDYIKANVPSAGRLMWHQTWAYNQDALREVMYKNYGSSAKMYEAIMAASEGVCKKYALEVIPCGTAIRNLTSSFERDNCHRDSFHLSYTTGRYTAACTWFEAIFHEDVTRNPYRPALLIPYRKEVCNQAAHLAIQQPFAFTNMAKNGYGVPEAQYDEAKIPSYTLPDPLVMNDGTPVRDKDEWMQKRRPELLEMFTTQMFGKAPEPSEDMHFEVLRTKADALGGKATFKEVRVYFNKVKFAYMDLLVVTPNKVAKAPVFLGINFFGNYAVCDDEWITIPEPLTQKYGVRENTKRGVEASRWPLEAIVDAGFGVVTFYRGDVAPDFDNAQYLGVCNYMRKGAWRYPAADEWGAVAAWAWGLGRAMDYLQTDASVDASRVAVIGHSRLGKAALWAGACDERFKMVISNESGCGGAAISRRRIGETVEVINKHFPHWFCDNFKQYNGREDELPFDQHELLALIAPRALYVASADRDRWSDPVGEGLALQEALKVYSLFGKPVTGRHVREGRHDINAVDWEYYIKFAKKNL